MSTRSQRPLSPHLQIYKPQLTSVLSILFRVAGVFSTLGTLVLVAWLASGAAGQASYDFLSDMLGSALGRLALFGWTLALVYHLCNGVRHLFWDAGLGLSLDAIKPSALAVLASSLGLTALLWALAFFVGGA